MNEKKDGLLDVITELLYRIIYDNAYSNILFNEDYKYNSMTISQKKFIQNVVLGVVEKKIFLDFVLNQYNLKKIRIKPRLKIIIYVGLYVKFYMDSKNEAIFVNRVVNYSKIKYLYAKNFVNYILRNAKLDEINYDELNEMEKFSIKNSINMEIIELLYKQYSLFDLNEIFLHKNSNIHLRVNTKYYNVDDVFSLLKKENINIKKNDLLEYVIDIIDIKDKNIKDLNVYKNSMVYVQDVSSALVANVCKLEKNFKILDLCASPGGKSTHFAQYVDDFNVYSTDIYEHKLKLVEENAKRLNLKLNIKLNDATLYNDEFCEKFDIVLVDAPCSAIGIINRKPELRIKNINFKDIEEIQLKILENAKKYVKEDGYIIYSTCTINKYENELLINKFLEENKNFEREKIDLSFVKDLVKLDNRLSDDILLLPNIYRDGFYISKIHRRKK